MNHHNNFCGNLGVDVPAFTEETVCFIEQIVLPVINNVAGEEGFYSSVSIETNVTIVSATH